MTNLAVFNYYGKDEIVRDIVNYCVNNPNTLNFGEKLDITYRKLEFGMGYVSVMIDYKDYNALYDFKVVAELIREARDA